MDDIAELDVRKDTTDVGGALSIKDRPTLSEEAKHIGSSLMQDGLEGYMLSGATPRRILARNYTKFWTIDPSVKDRSSRPSYLFFDPRPEHFFLPESFNCSPEQHSEMLKAEQARIDELYPDSGIVVRMADSSEWAELAYKHFLKAKENKKIFGEAFDYGFTRTRDGLEVGSWGGGGLNIREEVKNIRPNLGVVPVYEVPTT